MSRADLLGDGRLFETDKAQQNTSESGVPT